jgi:CrcB protein
MNFIWVFIGGGLGSVARYAIGFIFSRWIQSSFPWATFISNLLATGILGVIIYLFMVRWQSQSWIYTLLAVGFCGGFSTFSTFSSETVNLISAGNYMIATLNILVSVTSGIAVLLFLQRFN